MTVVRWGIVGPGAIAAGFAEALGLVDDASLVAVASRSEERAEAFGDRFDIPRRYGAYDMLVANPEIDAVYVATPHSSHEEDTLRAIAHGKHVLCEKPMSTDPASVERMMAAAGSAGVLLMEALWSRFLPGYQALAEVLTSGRIGDPLVVEADFGFRMPVDPAHRLFDPRLGGGAVLDLGIYPLHLARLVLGDVRSASAEGAVGSTGVEETVAAVLRHDGDGISVVQMSIRANLPCTARIAGTDGTIDIPAFMHCPTSFIVTRPDGQERIETPFENGLQFQVQHFQRCLAAGRTESPTMPHEETLALAVLMDELRRQVGAIS